MRQIKHKVLDHGEVVFEDRMGTDKRIVEAARRSTRTHIPAGLLEGDSKTGLIMDGRDQALLRHLIVNEHDGPFEHPHLSLSITCPYFVATQILRHRTFNFSVESGRYSDLNNPAYIPDKLYKQDQANRQCADANHSLDKKDGDRLRAKIRKHHEAGQDLYQQLRSAGVAREEARVVLSVSYYTSLFITADLRNLLHFLALRLAPDAQLETREFAKAIAHIVWVCFPHTYLLYRELRIPYLPPF